MAIRDEIRQEQQKVKDMSFSGKLGYIWDYYKIHILVGVLVLIGAIVFFRDFKQNRRPDYVNAVVLNTILTYDQTDSDISADFIDFAKVDTETYKVSIDTSLQMSLERSDQMTMAAEQKLMALFSTGEIDVLMAPEAVIDFYAGGDAFCDITALLSEAKLKELADAGYPLYYVDGENGTYPAGFYLNNSEYLKNLSDNGTFIPEDNAVFAVTSCMKHPDAVLQLIDMITGLK